VSFFDLGSGDSTATVHGATIVNSTGALFDLPGDNLLMNNNGAPGANVFDNAGTLRKSAGSGVSTIGVALDNSGSVEVEAGTLQLGGGGSSSASAFSVTAGATLGFSGGSFAMTSGTYDVDGLTAVSGGTVDFTGATVVDFAGGL